MGPFSVEVRSASVVVRGADTYDVPPGAPTPPGALHLHPSHEGSRTGAIEFDRALIPALRAALDQASLIDEHGPEFQWARRDATGALVRVVPIAFASVDCSSIEPAVWLAALRKPETRDLVAAAAAHPGLVEPEVAARLADAGLDGLSGRLGAVLAAARQDWEERTAAVLADGA